MQDQLAQRLGVTVEDVAALAINEPAATLAAAVERLRSTPDTPDQLVVSGLVYDTAADTMTEVVAPAPLRGS